MGNIHSNLSIFHLLNEVFQAGNHMQAVTFSNCILRVYVWSQKCVSIYILNLYMLIATYFLFLYMVDKKEIASITLCNYIILYKPLLCC